jgi:hypothetical protein
LGEQAVTVALRAYPSGWFLEDRCIYVETLQQLVESLQASPTHFPRQMPSLVSTPQEKLSLTERIQTPISFSAFPALSNAIRQTFWLQFQIDAARTTCALERYRLAHGALPPTLDALCPEFLSKPTLDLITGEPLHYLPGPGDSYTLYSVGWDEIDDGGNDVNPKNPSRKNSPDSPDWVWKIDSRS